MGKNRDYKALLADGYEILSRAVEDADVADLFEDRMQLLDEGIYSIIAHKNDELVLMCNDARSKIFMLRKLSRPAADSNGENIDYDDDEKTGIRKRPTE